MAVQAVAGIVAATVIGAGSIFTTTATGVAPADPTIPCGAVWERLPDDLKHDLTALRGMTPEERDAALRQIRHDALDGDYGGGVQHWAEHRDERRAWLRTHLPAELKQDLRAALRLPAGERHDALVEVRDHALDGDYGAGVQRAAERLQERREACRADGS